MGSIEDTLNPHTRVKLEAYDDYLFLVLRSAEPKRLCLFIGRNYIVSVHSGDSSSVARVTGQVAHDPSLLDSGGPARVAHLISDAVVDEYFPILERVDDFVDRLEHIDFPEVDRSTFQEALLVRKCAFAARQSIVPQRDIFDELAHRPGPFVSTEARLYFRDVFDHAVRITESLDAYRELIANTTDSFLARSSMRLDYATKVFATIATVVMPFFVVSELYGMNVRGIPLSASPYGFWAVVAVEVACSAVLLIVLRWRRLA